ncbi:HD domain-containing protein [Nonomuraea sp. NPDC050404]|uniref:HD domain-containing protein n=1 Tax=Nonomuraea sp. NPDC050404 TaxID=3155783 RepID=UPI0033C41E75
MNDTFDGLPFPRTDLALSAMRFARDIEDRAIFNHSMRTYLYARLLGQQEDLRPGHDHDDELLLLGCALHGAGLSDQGNGDQGFDLDGADLAAGFLTGHGLAPQKAEIVWDAIALHLYPGVAGRKRPEIALVSAGAGFDLNPSGPYARPTGYADRVHAVLPCLHATAVLRDTIVAQALDSPHKAPPFTLPGELLRRQAKATWPTWEQPMAQDPCWHDYDGYQPMPATAAPGTP